MIRYLSAAKASELRGTAILRLDFNTEDNWRMLAVLPTLRLLSKKALKVVILSHRGRPQGAEPRLSLRGNAVELGRLLKKKIHFVPSFDFDKIRKEIAAAPAGSIFLLENLRFDPGEEANDSRFARRLASLGDYYVNDAFAVSHRANASVAAIARFLPGYAGLEIEREIAALSRVMRKPKHPVVFIAGGAKVADKLAAIEYFQKKADWFLLGGGPANTVLAFRGMDVKQSLQDDDSSSRRMMSLFSRLKRVVAPVDVRWRGDRILDIGPRTARLYAEKIAGAKTILWSGPLGMIEKPAYARGSIAVARAVVRNRRAFSVSGGGETVMFLKKYGFAGKFGFISTGGGAMIDFLAGKKLPGIAALEHSLRRRP